MSCQKYVNQAFNNDDEKGGTSSFSQWPQWLLASRNGTFLFGRHGIWSREKQLLWTSLGRSIRSLQLLEPQIDWTSYHWHWQSSPVLHVSELFFFVGLWQWLRSMRIATSSMIGHLVLLLGLDRKKSGMFFYREIILEKLIFRIFWHFLGQVVVLSTSYVGPTYLVSRVCC